MIPNPWLVLGVVLVWIASLAAVGRWQHDAGVISERVKNQAKENSELVAANKEIERLRKVERTGAAQIITIGDDHARQIAALEAQHASDLARVRAGALKLRVPGACHSPARSGEVPAPAKGSDGTTDGELPREVAANLLDFADEADRNTNQLAACQAVVTAYLKIQEEASRP